MAVDSESKLASAPAVEKQQQPKQGLNGNGTQDGKEKSGTDSQVVSGGYSEIDGIADKFRRHLIIPVISKFTGNSSWTVLVPGDIITGDGISVDTINDSISSKADWRAGDVVADSVAVRAVIGRRGLLLSAQQPNNLQQDTSVHLDESGSSANVSLVVQPNGTLEVHKTCSHDGIDENGRPWLERQNRFLETSIAVQETLRRTICEAAGRTHRPTWRAPA